MRDRVRERIVRSWSPILAAREVRVGEWWMVDEGGLRYAIIVSLQLGTDAGPHPCYRIVTGESSGRRLVDYAGTLRAACHRAHVHYLSEAGPGMSSLYGRVDKPPMPDYPLAAVEYERLQRGRNVSG